MYNGILNSIESEIETEGSSVNDKELLLKSIEKLKQQKLNILFVGATGVGKI